jgi:hypothetical protein
LRVHRINWYAWALAGLVVGLSWAQPVRASFVVNTANTVPGVVANSLIVDGDGDDWNTAVLLIELTAGSVYNDPNFDSLQQQQSFWGLIPALEFDSWVGIPGDGTGSVIGGAGDLGDPGPAVIADQKVSVTWFNTDLNNTSTVRIANMSLTSDAVGTWSLIVGFAGGTMNTESGVVMNGILGPTPPLLVTGDLDGDGFVGLDDLNIVLSDWNLNVTTGSTLSDPSGDGFVGIDDLNIVLSNWNAGTPPNQQATIPEPGTCSLFSVAVFSLLRRRTH